LKAGPLNYGFRQRQAVTLSLTALLRAFPFVTNSGFWRSLSPLQLRGQWRIGAALPVHFLRFLG